MKCTEISADWAAQRIKGLSLGAAVWNALKFSSDSKDRRQLIKTLIDSFRYPRKGPGMMWEECARKLQSQGGILKMGEQVIGCQFEPVKKNWIIRTKDQNKRVYEYQFDQVISSAPIREIALDLIPRLSEKAIASANALKYRDFLTVILILEDKKVFHDNWIYIHDPSVRVGRIQNFKSWSPEMVPDSNNTCYGLEYFCFEGDNLWNSSDNDLLELGKSEIEKIGIARASDVFDGCVVRQSKAYPVYDENYLMHVKAVASEIEDKYPGLHLVGRNGMHKYNNQDHAMMTAILCVENIKAGDRIYNLWQVNQDAEYLEEGEAGRKTGVVEERLVPRKIDLTKKAG